MKLPIELIRQVTLGTFTQSNSLVIKDQENELFIALDNASEKPLEARLLLQVLAYNVQHQAGFKAMQLNAKLLEKVEIVNSGSALKFEAVEHFIKMLAGGIDVELLPEWCRLVVKSGQYLPDEFAPIVMRFGHRLDTNRIYLRGVLSDKAVWLAQYSQVKEWQWVLTTPILEGTYLLGIRRERERDLINLIANTSPKEIQETILPHFAIYLQPWSESLAEIFLREVLEQIIMDAGHRFSYLDSLENFAYFAPMKFHHEILPYLHVSEKDVNLTKRYEAIRRIMSLREEMQRSIYSSLPNQDSAK